ncbi:MAG TPA: methyltransferase domain-containing protein [Lichenihabitans sp.]|jgi:SAM-dependent methyltransferase|nr:methyltransferase domain-containing protein [Lichenihabitans sp.]
MLSILSNRKSLSHYLIGDGIEIGALDSPMEVVAAKARVRYADRLSTDELKCAYPTLKGIQSVDLVLSGADLPVPDGSQDFIIGNHVIEHIVNPLGALASWHRALRPGGILFLAYPVPEYCPDRPRRRVTLNHLIDDFRVSRRTNADEHSLAMAWAWENPGILDRDELARVLDYLWRNDLWFLDDTAQGMIDKNRSFVDRMLQNNTQELHQHAFELGVFKDAFEFLSNDVGVHYAVEDLSLERGLLSEHIIILRKHADRPTGGSWSALAEGAEERERLLETTIRAIARESAERATLCAEREALIMTHESRIAELTEAASEREVNSLPPPAGLKGLRLTSILNRYFPK